eukprot:9705006-Prorocentrum_lima.AAC.1
MAVDTCILEPGDDRLVWEVKLHFPQALKKENVALQMNMFKNEWETSRPDFSVGWSDKYNTQ